MKKENSYILDNKQPIGKKTFWIASLFYILIAFEFMFMASPFAIYFYAVYGKGLGFLNDSPILAWLCRAFLPHIVKETYNGLLDIHNIIGWILIIFGFTGFCFGAAQVYYYKLTRKKEVIGGIYRIIRHPQYASLIICGLGLLILWPRYIALLSYLFMLFVYYFLAKMEERECEEKFGETYIEYKRKTQMFFPIRIAEFNNYYKLPSSGFIRYLTIVTLYIITAVCAIGLANLLEEISINSLYAKFNKDAAYISISKMEQAKLTKLVKIANANPEVQKHLMSSQGKNNKFINYILPVNWYVQEIPMNKVYEDTDHYLPDNYDKNIYKIVFTKAILRNGQEAEGKEILFSAAKRIPVIEVIVNLSKNSVTRIANPPVNFKYMNIPVPLY
ncbi:MAG: isoprenylcysteine carboxylmethyltransferase family protein [Ignavibacteriales bacterium]|nr:isoprenylcysteine carboxylmethyltransferase family protein [Ignavibacteriales bacterium]